MSYLLVCLVALLASGLTLFSGFGLGTLLLPAFSLFFPVEIAVSATAVVHLINSLFKLLLVGSKADPRAVLTLGVPAIPGAVAGAWVLTYLSDLPELVSYDLLGRPASVTGVKLVVAVLIAGFALLELRSTGGRLPTGSGYLLVGGLAMGFFGGLSGHQGGLRSAFLIRYGLSKEAFIGTGVACAVLVDISRLAVYGWAFLAIESGLDGRVHGPLILAATAAALTGAWIGVRLMDKVSLTSVHRLVRALLLALALGLALGVI